VGSSGIFMTARSRGSCTPSSRSSLHTAPCRTATRAPPLCLTTRSTHASRRGHAAARALLTEALADAERATSELRELAHGILPVILTEGGLRSGVDALPSRMSVPVETAVPADRLSPAVEATAYFVVAEALTNVAKHARAAQAAVRAGGADRGAGVPG